VDTIQDQIDSRDTEIKHRSSAGSIGSMETASRASSTSSFTRVLDSMPRSGFYQETRSISHPARATHIRLGLPGRNEGGPFTTKKVTFELSSSEFNLTRNFGSSPTWVRYYHNGILFPTLAVYDLAALVASDDMASSTFWTTNTMMSKPDMQMAGEQIMLSVVPTSAPFDAMTSVGELISDGTLFAIPGKSLLLNDDIGSEYLNTVFGVLPTTGDLGSLHKAVKDFDGIIKQYYRDANKVIRRRTKPRALPETVTVSSVSSTNPIAASRTPLNANLAANSKVTTTTRTNREIWYAGAFEYYIPENLSLFEKKYTEWSRAYGINPDPASLWNLFPFSWMSDWFINGEDSLRHLFLQSSEGATQRYGYVMCHTTRETEIVWSGNLYHGSTPIPHSITAKVIIETKQRERVSPFGVHYTGVDFSPRQLGILAALGIAR
jgi:hypothetical protein